MADPNQPKKQGIRYNVMSFSVIKWGRGLGEGNGCSGTCWALDGEKIALCIIHFITLIFISIIVVIVFSLCCSVKLSLTHEFCLFLPILIPTPPGGRNDRATTWFLVAGWG